VKAPPKIAGEDWQVTEEPGRLIYQDDAGLLDLPAPRLAGRHQFENAGVAIAALRATGLTIAPAAFEAIAKADWPARMQLLSHGKLIGLLPPGSELWLDGGHNPDGARAIASAVADLEERVSRPLVLIVGMLASKDSEAFLRNFSGLARHLVAVPIPDQKNSVPADTLATIARAVNIPAQSSDSVAAALAEVGRLGLAPPPRVLITGSLYLAGAVLAANGTPPA
jgi:dihydrofolate synthase/folylpolyglutamate synthase